MPPVTVAELDAYIVAVPLRKQVKHASHARQSSDNVVVRCKLSDGSVGWGEGVPRDYVTGETAGGALDLLKAADWNLAGCNDFAESVQLAESFALPAVPGDDRGCATNAARCAVELALLDAYGRAFGEPLMNVTKMVAPELYAPRPVVRYDGIVLSAKGWKARVTTLAQRVYGLKQLKVKVGIAGQDDVRRLRQIRRVAGPGIDLRVDANEAWTAGECAERIRALMPADVSSVEQPVRHEDVACLAEVRKRVTTPVMLDESLCSMTDAERAVAGGWCDRFNLRLSKCGGFVRTLRLASYATAHGLGYQLGCQVGETAILSAAGRHFATSVKGVRYLEGSYDRRLVLDWLTTEDITFGRGGLAPMLTGSGLGVTVEPERVAFRATRREQLRGG
jgi:L-alanine-DL-glutamate epimerase-like enolase superfamily enzyme